MPHSSDTNDSTIPVLKDVIVPGNADKARAVRGETPFSPASAERASGAAEPVAPKDVEARVEPVFNRHAHEEIHAPAPSAAQPTPPSIAQVPPLDADVLAERLRGRFVSYLTGEGREVIEARCREALRDHTTWLVNHITREVALTLETEVTNWIRQAVAEELARRPAEN